MDKENVLARNCKECSYALSCHKEGYVYCNRLDNPSLVFEVPDTKEMCLYILPGRRLLESEILERDSAAKVERLRFTNFLDSASRTIAQWPDWKREVLG
jgi:hypothetical protein